jgi:hypothetical protein
MVDLKDWKKMKWSLKVLLKTVQFKLYKYKRDFHCYSGFSAKYFLYIPHKAMGYNPLKLIKNILETGNINAIESLKKSDGEFGYIGNLFGKKQSEAIRNS